jgi:acyl-CoA reductase-like NAD-dependent aldehyde dehydrogenase
LIEGARYERLQRYQALLRSPVAAVVPYDTVDDAVAIANDSDYDLSAGAWRADTKQAWEVARRLRSGTEQVLGGRPRLRSPLERPSSGSAPAHAL